jgi:hypothetical protein
MGPASTNEGGNPSSAVDRERDFCLMVAHYRSVPCRSRICPQAPSFANRGASGGRCETPLCFEIGRIRRSWHRYTQERRRGYDIQGHMRQCRRIFLTCGLGTCFASALIPPLSIRPVNLDLRWKLGPVWLIGFRTPSSLFCLQLLARDQMRMHLRSSTPFDLVLWIIAPNARASAKEIAIA